MKRWALGLFGLFFYSYFIEPSWLEINYKTFKLNTREPFTIAHLSDFHLKQIGKLELKTIQTIEKEKPDLILITGDQIDDLSYLPDLSNFLRSLNAPLGVWAIKGNWENWRPIQDEKEFYKRSGANLILNESITLKNGIKLVGLDDIYSSLNEEDPLRLINSKENNCILLFHSPQLFEKASQRCPLSLSGHTHGGQIRLPFFSPFWLPTGSGNYISGWYEKGSSKMHVSRGLGTSILPLRLFSRPEISFIRIEKEKE